MEVDTEAQKLADELTKWLKEGASRSARIVKEISVKTPLSPKVPVVCLFSVLSNSL